MESNFVYYNANPFGLRQPDCVYRAMSLFFNVTWREALDDLVRFTADRGKVSNDNKAFEQYLKEEKGLVKKKPPENVTVEEFRRRFAEPGKTYLVHMRGHLSVIKDRKIYDTWDCSNKKLNGYWVRYTI